MELFALDVLLNDVIHEGATTPLDRIREKVRADTADGADSAGKRCARLKRWTGEALPLRCANPVGNLVK